MSAGPWADLDVRADPDQPGRFHASISEPWMLAVVPQGGVVAALAVRAMARHLDRPDQTLRTTSALFAGKVDAGPVVIDVRVLRQGRSMSQLEATVHNPGSEAGLTAVAAFGTTRRGFSFTDLTMPDVPGPDGLRRWRDGVPDDVDFELTGDPWPFWEQVVEARSAIGRAPWEPFEDGPAECANWYRLDDPPVLDDGRLDPLALLVMCDTMPGSVGQKVGHESGDWFAPSVDLTFHLLDDAAPGFFLAHDRARHAGDGYASVDCALWSQEGRLVAYATQVMLFTFAD